MRRQSRELLVVPSSALGLCNLPCVTDLGNWLHMCNTTMHVGESLFEVAISTGACETWKLRSFSLSKDARSAVFRLDRRTGYRIGWCACSGRPGIRHEAVSSDRTWLVDEMRPCNYQHSIMSIFRGLPSCPIEACSRPSFPFPPPHKLQGLLTFYV